WLTFLSGNKFLQTKDQKSQGCCEMLLEQWEKDPSEAYFKQMLTALSSLKDSPHTPREELDKAYAHFVRGCIKNGKETLLKEAKNILYSETYPYNQTQFLSSSDRAHCTSEFICSCTNTVEATTCLEKALKLKIFTREHDALYIE